MNRRTLLIGGGAGVGLIVAFAAWPRRGGSPLRAAAGEEVFGPYLRIATDGRVTVAVPQAETGQGTWTGLAQIAADELGAAWDSVAVEPAPLAPRYANPLVGDTRLTAQSSSIRAFEAPLREAAAMARAMLLEAAAAQWDVDASDCQAQGGFVVNGARRLAFGEMAEAAAKRRPPATPTLRPGVLAGKSLPRLDLPAKSDGSLRFAGDVRLPGLRFVSVRLAPPGGRVTAYDRAAAGAKRARIVANDHWLAAVAETTWAASRALDAAAPRFSGPADADTPAIDQALVAALDAPMDSVVEQGDYDAAVAGKRPLAATYSIAPTPHLSLEPTAVTVRLSSDGLELWMATIAPDLARAAAAKAAGIDEGQVTLYPMPVGDGGGGAVDSGLVAIAIAVARAVNAPVSLTMPAATAQNHDALRPPLAARISALGDEQGGLASWHGRFVGAAGLDADLARARGEAVPAFVARGAAPPYAAAAMRIEAASVALPIACGYMRGDVEPLTAFANESFVDEMARARGVEPLAFRIGLLGGQPRLARALSTRGDARRMGRRRARQLARAWPARRGFGSVIGLLAEATIGLDQRIAVTRLVAAVDAGRLVNPGLVRQQVEGGLLACPGQRDRPRAGNHRRHAARAPARRAWAADAQGAAQGRGRAAVQRRGAGRGQRARRAGACRGGRQCDLRRHRNALASAAVRPDECGMIRPPTTPSSPPPVGVLLTNLGTPDAPDAGGGAPLPRRISVRPAGDRDSRTIAWQPILHGIILRTRPKKSAHAYRAGVDRRGLAARRRSPRARRTALQARLGDSVMRRLMPCATAIRRSASAIDRLFAAGATRILVAPLYPQYCAGHDRERTRRRPSPRSPRCAGSRRCARCRPITTIRSTSTR